MAFRRFPEGSKPEFTGGALRASLLAVVAVGSLAVYSFDELQPVRDGVNAVGNGILKGLAAVGESG